MDIAGFDSSYAALYYPWIQVMDPATNRPIQIPPSGHMAGVWARNDATRGVHKAPANEVVQGAIGLAYQTTKGEQDTLNPDGVNCIRAFPRPRHPRVGRAHAQQQPVLAVHQRAAAVQLRREVD